LNQRVLRAQLVTNPSDVKINCPIKRRRLPLIEPY
jgi:hypothetical protein